MLTCPYSLNKLVESHPFYSKEYLIYHSFFWGGVEQMVLLVTPCPGTESLKMEPKAACRMESSGALYRLKKKTSLHGME